MELNWFRYEMDVVEFYNCETLRQIDYGTLDFSRVKNPGLRDALIFLEELLTMELRLNYLENDTGLFRVESFDGGYCYREFGYVLEADSVCELKELVLAENRIWYVFDELLALKMAEGCKGL